MPQTIRFYTDEHVAPAIVRGLRLRGVDVVSVAEAGLLGASDEVHLQFALAEQRVIFTQDDDFLRFHAAGVVHAGLVYAPQHSAIDAIIRGLMLIYQVLETADMQGTSNSYSDYAHQWPRLVRFAANEAVHMST